MQFIKYLECSNSKVRGNINFLIVYEIRTEDDDEIKTMMVRIF